MKYPTKLADAIHILALIALNPNDSPSSAVIAKSVHTNPSYVRQLISALRKGGILLTEPGKTGAVLSKKAESITLFEIYTAILGEAPLLHQDTHTNPKCGVGVNIQHAIKDAYDIVQKNAENTMKEISLAQILKNYEIKISNISK
ncbi:Rrf2 family transcriptional regulator [Campylobacter suis]|uniref:HTH-type transcriptional regulator YwnA n=1 Tax=Campylobacter suis TaxID=2790657 RepID=A0ABM8Q0I0_9BACT|nr:Rrf2 family transcriptional regulator [Campylobacter suis]CAD7286300.1 Putative HTH-type transcriptional regulator YwnA [Campylobacter suis]